MNKKIFRAILIFAFAISISACTKNETEKEMVPETKTESSMGNKLKTSLKEMIAKGQSYKCVFEVTDPETNITSQSTTYISGNKFRQEMLYPNTDPSAKKIVGFMVSDGEYVYTWSDDKKDSGMKMKIDSNQEDSKTDIGSTKLNVDQEYEMSCDSWTKDDTVFSLPKDVRFTDLSELMKSIPNMPDVNNLSE